MLENAESFQVLVSAMDQFVIILPTQDDIVINIIEDPLDGLFIYSYLKCMGIARVMLSMSFLSLVLNVL